MIDRRAFITTAAGLLAAPLGAAAQQPAKVARLGYLSTAAPSRSGKGGQHLPEPHAVRRLLAALGLAPEPPPGRPVPAA